MMCSSPNGWTPEEIATGWRTDQAQLLLDRARWIAGGHVGPMPETLPPEIECEAVDAFRKFAEFLEALAAMRRARQRGAA